MQLSAHMSKCRELLWAFRPVGAEQSVPAASQLCAIEEIIWKEQRRGCKKRGRSDLCNLNCVMLAQ